MPVVATIAIIYFAILAVTLFVFLRFGWNYHRMYGRSDELEKGLDDEIDKEAEKVVKANRKKEKQLKDAGRKKKDSRPEGDRRDD